MKYTVKDKVVVITGSSRGIGYKTAALYLEKGARVVLNGRDAGRLESAREQLDPDGTRTLVIRGDMTSEKDAARLVTETVSQWGGIDILICNAGLMMRGKFADLTEEVATSIITTNVIGVTLPITKALPEVEKRKGSIVIISSLAGVRGMPHISLYCASKMALTAIAQALWVELAGSGVHLGILYVGITENDPDKLLLAAGGGNIQVTRKGHSTQEQVAATIYRQVARRKRRVVMTPAGKALVTVQWLMPRVVTFLVTKAQKISAGVAK